MKEYQLIIFDWDGTLMDSVGRIVSSMQKAALASNLAVPSKNSVKDIIGLSLQVSMQRLFPGSSEEEHKTLIQHYSHYYKHLDDTPTPLFPDIARMVQQLHVNGKLLAVATGKSRNGLERVLAETDMASLFCARRGADEAKSKPDPLMLQQILHELSIPVQSAVMVGDSVHDLAMAQAIGMDSIGVSWGVHNKTMLESHQPIAIVDSVAELYQQLSGTLFN
jgi:haloacid dehalogenase superfamily, subfamily IA, variant 3 with third motif having DD or ED/haloacid dehalogenase superfamily, subfamily IA, variant 1 with third motif having Dx(3-4)D or Dx(3-4)E